MVPVHDTHTREELAGSRQLTVERLHPDLEGAQKVHEDRHIGCTSCGQVSMPALREAALTQVSESVFPRGGS